MTSSLPAGPRLGRQEVVTTVDDVGEGETRGHATEAGRGAVAGQGAVVHELLGCRPRECVVCYLARMVERFGCDGTWRWAQTWRDQRAPRATRLERRLGARAARCDCEVLLRAYEVDPRLLTAVWDAPLGRSSSGCLGVRAGSTQPCGLWRPVRRGWWAGDGHDAEGCEKLLGPSW